MHFGRVKHHSLGGFRKNLQCSLNQGKNKEMTHVFSNDAPLTRSWGFCGQSASIETGIFGDTTLPIALISAKIGALCHILGHARSHCEFILHVLRRTLSCFSQYVLHQLSHYDMCIKCIYNTENGSDCIFSLTVCLSTYVFSHVFCLSKSECSSSTEHSSVF